MGEIYKLEELKHLKRVKTEGKFKNTYFQVFNRNIPYGLVVRIRGFHPRGPGSIPGMGNTFY